MGMNRVQLLIVLLAIAWITAFEVFIIDKHTMDKQNSDFNGLQYFADSINRRSLEKSDSIRILKQQLFKANTIKGLTATVYYPTGDCMRSGVLIPHHYHHSSSQPKYIAISQDLWRKNGGPLTFGDRVLVHGISKQFDVVYEVQDTMNKRHKKRVDILVEKNLLNEQWKNIQITKV